MADTRTYIKVHDGLPDHAKVEGLSDRAFRLLIETWCWCSRQLNNGEFPKQIWNRRGTAKARRELVNAGLVVDNGDTVTMHDYLKHQRSAEDVETMKRSRSQRGSAGAHRRWHIGKDGTPSIDCDLCREQYPWLTEPEPIANGWQPAMTNAWQSNGQAMAEAEGSLPGSPGQAEADPGVDLAGVCPETYDDDHAPRQEKPDQPEPSEPAVTSANDEPPDPSEAKCPQHRTDPDPPDCGRCAGYRRDYERRLEAHQRRQEAQRRADAQAASKRARTHAEDRERAIDECPLMCRDNEQRGYINGQICDHDPNTPQRAKRGSAAAREALTRRKDAS